MAGFQSQLNDEMERRGLIDNEEEKKSPPKKEKKKKVKTPIGFSFSAMLYGVLLSALIIVALMGWAYFNFSNAQQKFSEFLASKTVIIEKTEPMNVVNVEPMKATPPQNVETQIPREPEVREQNEPVNTATNTNSMIQDVIPGLYESTDLGLKPKIRESDGATPFEAYKKLISLEPETPKLSFVVNNLGLSSIETEKIIDDLPATVSLAFSPYSPNLQALIKKARQDGHEVWLTLPLEPANYPLDDPGPLTLLRSASTQQNADRLARLLTAATSYVGFIPIKNHIFDKETAKTSPAIKEIFERGLAVIDSKTGGSNFMKDLAARKNYPYASNNFWLDFNLTQLSMNRQLRKAMELSKAKGSTIVMLEPYPASLNTLQKFLSSAVARNFQIVPASALVQYGE
ncbi:MAG: divergent polysaccharide deacetylase family protein [Pseudomonadota bacterium]